MAQELEVGIRITVDGKGLIVETQAAKQALGGLGDAANKTGSELGQTAKQSDALEASTARLKVGIAAATVTLGAFAATSVSSSLEFRKSMALISTQIDGTVDDLNRLESIARSTAVQFGTMPVEQSRAFYEIISAGIEDVTQATELLQAANKLAIGGNTDLATSVDGLTNIMNSYSGKVASAEAVSDALFIGMKAGKATMSEFSSDLGRVTPIASALNVSFDELVASIAALSKQGISTAESVTGVRAILASVAKPTKEATDLAEQLGLQFNAAGLQAKGFGGFLDEISKKTGGNVDQIALLFGGVEALVPAMALAGQAGKDFSQIMEDMENKAEATQDAFDKMAAIPGAKIEELMASINNIAITLGDTLAGFLAPAAAKAAAALNHLTGTGPQLSAIEQQKQMIAGLREELASLNDRKNLIDAFTGEKISELFFDKRSADLLSQRIDDAVADLFKLEEAADKAATAVNAVETTGVVKPNAKPTLPDHLIKALKAEQDAREKAAKIREREAQQAMASSQRIIEALKMETEQVGKSAVQKRMLAAAAEAAKAPTKALAMEIMASAQAFALATQREEELQQAEKARLETIREIEKAEREAARAAEEASRQAAAEWNHLWGGVEQTAKQAFVQFAAHGKSAMESIGESIKVAIIDVLYQLTVRKWIINIGASLSGIPGTAGAASGGGMNLMDMANFGSSITNALGTGFGATTFIGNSLSALGGSSLLGSFGAGMAGGAEGAAFIAAESAAAGAGGAASMGSAFGTGLAGLGGGIIGTFGGSMIAGDKKVGGLSGSTTSSMGATVGGAIGSIWGPAGAAIGAILGGLIGGGVNALFGRGPLKQKETNLIGDVTADGFSGITSTKFKAKGGAFRSDKIDRVMTDTDSGQLLDRYGELVEGGISKVLEPFAEQAKAYALELGKYLDESIGNISKSARGMADTLGMGSDALDNFSMSINIASEKGKALTDEQIAQVIADAGEQMARHLIPEIDSLSKTGESAFQTLQRLSGEFNVLTNLGAALGNSLADTRAFLRSVSFEQRSTFVDAAGGMDALASNAQFFSDNFLTDAERLQPKIELLNQELGKLGLSSDMTKEQFKALVQSFGQANGISEDMLLGLLNVQHLFVQVQNGLESIGQAAAEVIPKLDAGGLLNDAFGMLQRSVEAERKTVTKNYNDSLKQVSAEIGIVTSNISKLKGLSDGLKSTVASIRGLGINDARQQIADAIVSARKGIFPDLNKIQPALQALQGQSAFGFSTREDFERARAANANLIGELGGLTDDQLDAEERMLDELERNRSTLQTGFDNEMARLNSILESSRQEVDALTGLNTTLLSLVDALANFRIARDAAVDSGGTTTHPAMVLGGTGNSSISAADIRNFIGSGKTPDEILQAALQHGISAQQVVAAMGGSAGFTLDNIRRFAASRGITGFASGGVHPGGVRIVGELGPELEMTGPSRIYSNQQTRDLLGSSEIVAAIKELATAVRDSTGYSKKTADLLMRVTRDGESLRTVAA
jgi:TP901 family phage tail tape measure protein